MNKNKLIKQQPAKDEAAGETDVALNSIIEKLDNFIQ